MSYRECSPADRRQARAVFRAATLDPSPEINAAALQWGAVLITISAAVLIAFFIAAWITATVIGPRAGFLLPVTVIVAIPCARALHQRNVLRRELREQPRRAA